VTFPGILPLIGRASSAPTPESRALEAVLSNVWADVSKGLDLSQPFVVELTWTRMRRTWRGRRFSYQAHPRITGRNVETFWLR
jgi:hypothetical protein